MTGYSFRAEEIDTSKAHSARMYDYFLGGKSHYAIDAAAGAKVEAVWPDLKVWMRANRSFMQRATRWLAAEAGVRQFLDIGSGIPTEPNLHQVAQSVAPECRVVYADNDPIVLTYAQALMLSAPAGRTAYLHTDVRSAEAILKTDELRATLDLTRPIAISLNAILHFIPNDDDPYDIVRRLMEPLASGSYLVITHGDDDPDPKVSNAVVELYAQSGMHVQPRTAEETARFFDGLELVEPGVVMPHRWKPESEEARVAAEGRELWLHAGVARKP